MRNIKKNFFSHNKIDKIQKGAVMQKKIEIFTVNYCPYCKKALAFLKENDIEFKQIDITDNEDEMRKKIGEFYNINGDVTVPQIIVDGVRIGGYDDMMADPKVVLG